MNEFLNTQDGRSRFGFGLIAVGVLFLFNQWFGWNLGGNLWPLFVMAPGLVFLYLAHTGEESSAGFYYPGAVITGTGLILFYQALTGNWASWAYIWALYPGFVGLALQLEGKKRGKRKQIETGREMTRWSLVAFAIGFLFFELIVFGNFGGLAVLLLGAGLLMVAMSRREGDGKSDFASKVKATPTPGMTY
ncbi:MAG TPA: hypothetical protein VHL11_14400, partial [Phototrophicaceae bacterium]|nr:hypothetical protein [Phototrophicaceae bacterium]